MEIGKTFRKMMKKTFVHQQNVSEPKMMASENVSASCCGIRVMSGTPENKTNEN